MSLNTRKQEKDYTEEVKALVPQVEALAKDGKLQDAIDKISALEKQTRNAADMTSTATLLTTLVRLCYEAGNLDALHTQLTLMSKKHGQLKEAVTRMVDEAMTWLPELKKQKDEGKFASGKDRWLELVQTLRDITEGKIYLELARARLTVMLASHHEALAETAPAEASTSTAPAVSVKTGKDEPKREPVTKRDHIDTAAEACYSILEQMRLESLRGNWARVRVGSRKINRVYASAQDLKLRYYDLMVQLALQEDAYLEACSAYQEVWDTEEVKKDEAREGSRFWRTL